MALVDEQKPHVGRDKNWPTWGSRRRRSRPMPSGNS